MESNAISRRCPTCQQMIYANSLPAGKTWAEQMNDRMANHLLRYHPDKVTKRPV